MVSTVYTNFQQPAIQAEWLNDVNAFVYGNGFTQTGVGTVPRTISSKLREIRTPYDYGAVGDGVTDDTVAVQKFLTDVGNGKLKNAEWKGVFAISANLTLSGGSSGLLDNTAIFCSAELRPTHTDDGAVLTIQNFSNFSLEGLMFIRCQGGNVWSTRLNGYGLKVIDCGSFSGGEITVFYAKFGGVDIEGISPMCDVKKIKTWRCGLGGPGTTEGQRTFTWNSNSGGTTTQRSLLTISSAVPGLLTGEHLAVIDSKVYTIRSVVGTQVEVYPWLPTATLSGTITFLMGYGFRCSGSDASALRIGMLDTLGCAMGISNLSLYPASIGNHVTQACGIGHRLARDPADGCIGGSVSFSYWEGNTFDIVQVTRVSNIAYHFVSNTALDITKCENAGRWLLPPASYTTDRLYLTMGDAGFTAVSYLTSTPIDPWNPNLNIQFVGPGGINTTIVDRPDPLIARGDQFFQTTIMGTTAKNGPGGTFTLNAPAGKTINGGASLVIPATVSGPLNLSGVLRLSSGSTNWVVAVNVMENTLQAQVAYNPPSLVVGAASAISTLAVTGAALGDFAEASFSLDMQGLTIQAWVSAADTVSYMTVNPSGNPTGTVDLASGTLRLRVRKVT